MPKEDRWSKEDQWALDDVTSSLPEDFGRTSTFYGRRLEDLSRLELYAVIKSLGVTATLMSRDRMEALNPFR